MRTRPLALAVLIGAALLAVPLAGSAAAAPSVSVSGGSESGYVVTGSTYTSVSTSWNVPTINCDGTSNLLGLWIGLDGYGDASVEQTGVAADCSSGRPVYSAWYEMYPAEPVYYSTPVSVGDVIKASITRSGSSFTLVIGDATRGWTKTTTKSYNAAGSSAEIIAECAPSSCPAFGVVTFTGSTVNGKPLADANPQKVIGLPGAPSNIVGGTFTIPGGCSYPVCPGAP